MFVPMEHNHKSPVSILKVDFKCSGDCLNDVRKKLSQFQGVESITIDPKKGLVIVEGDVEPALLLKVIRSMGQKAVLLSFEKLPDQEASTDAKAKGSRSSSSKDSTSSSSKRSSSHSRSHRKQNKPCCQHCSHDESDDSDCDCQSRDGNTRDSLTAAAPKPSSDKIDHPPMHDYYDFGYSYANGRPMTSVEYMQMQKKKMTRNLITLKKLQLMEAPPIYGHGHGYYYDHNNCHCGHIPHGYDYGHINHNCNHDYGYISLPSSSRPHPNPMIHYTSYADNYRYPPFLNYY